MKWFFFCLLAANLALLGWNWQQPDDMQTVVLSPPMPSTAGPVLVLLREMEAPLPARREQDVIPALAFDNVPSTAEPTGSNELAVQSPQMKEAQPASCLRVGGLETQAMAAAVVKALRQGGVVVRREGEESGEIKRYWVMLPSTATAAAAKPALERLDKGGIRDFYLIRSGENVNAISLGVFSARESAQKRVQQVRELRMTPKIEEITLPVKRWWLEFDWPSSEKEAGWRTLFPRDVRNVPAQACR